MPSLFSKKHVQYLFYGVLACAFGLNSFSWWLLTLSEPDFLQHRRMIPNQYSWKSESRLPKAGNKHAINPSTNVDPQIPEWITSYLQWHNETRQSLNASNWKDQKYLVSRCYYNDPQCGGLTDRLRSLPFLIQVAAMTGRILFFHWERPYDLPEFLEPVNIDWRLPSFVEVPRHTQTYTRVKDVPTIQNSSETVISIRFQAYKEAEKFFDRFKVRPSDANMTEVLAPLWKLFFRPTLPIRQRIDAFYKTHHITSSQYVAAHLRTLYDDDTTVNETKLVETVRNAFACASRFAGFSPSTRIFISADSRAATKMAHRIAPENAVSSYGANGGYSGPIIHLDRGIRFLERPQSGNISEYPVEAYYPTFVDFYLLLGARCIAFDRGGFGRLASLLSGDPTCSFDHRHHKC